MPPRTSRARVVAAPAEYNTAPNVRRAIAYHASQITVLWIVVIFMSLAGFLVMLSYMTRLDDAEYGLAEANQQVAQLTTQVEQLQQQARSMAQPVVSPTATTTMVTPAAPGRTSSPSGALDRGTLSPDGTKFAGYNDTVKTKIGLAVESVPSGKIHYIIIFPKSESTGQGTSYESQMSARWVDNQTILYDVLVTKNGQQSIETRTTKIYF